MEKTFCGENFCREKPANTCSDHDLKVNAVSSGVKAWSFLVTDEST